MKVNKNLILGLLAYSSLALGHTAFASGTNNCEALSKFKGTGHAFCGSYFGENGSTSTILCLPLSNGKFEIGGFFTRGNLTEEQNYDNCLDAAMLRNAAKVPDNLPQLPYPKDQDLQCIEARKGWWFSKLTFKGKVIGTPVYIKDCIEIVKNRVGDYICSGVGITSEPENELYPHHFSVVSLKKDVDRNGYQKRIGYLDDASICVNGLRGSKLGRFCSKGNYWWYLYDSKGHKEDMHFADLESCVERRDAAY